MYDEDARMLAPEAYAHDRGHWYDEPPYESDPEDFLMDNSSGPTATIQNGRVCFTLNLKREPRGEGVISLKTAGDISLPRDSSSRSIPSGISRRGVILPQAAYSPIIIPLAHSRSSRDRESEDYIGSDVQSVSSRLSTLSVDTGKSEQHVTVQMTSPQYFTQIGGTTIYYRKSGEFPRSDDGISPNHSSDYEDQVEFDSCTQQVATVHMSSDGRSTCVSNLIGKVRGLREDVHRKISSLKSEKKAERCGDHAFPYPASSIESLPSGSGSSTQALVRAESNHSLISAEEEDSTTTTSQIIGRARALCDYIPSPYDKEALKFKKGDIIDIVSMNASGQWKGILQGRKGTFKFINVELLSEKVMKVRKNTWHCNIRGKPMSVEDLLQKINLQEHTSVFVLNGYEDLELFKEIEPSDLDYLGIVNTDHRSKILTAVQLLHELDSGSEGETAGSNSEGDENNRNIILKVGGTYSSFGQLHYLRDSGCYDATLKISNETHPTPPQEKSDGSDNKCYCDTTNNLDSVVEQCNNEILARVRQAQKNLLNVQEDASNVLNSVSHDEVQRKTKDSYESVHGQTTLLDPYRRNLLNKVNSRKMNTNLEDCCEAEQKLHTDINLSETNNTITLLGRGGSEKSSDSGVSSSSLSSGYPKESHQSVMCQNVTQSSSNIITFTNCANCTTSNSAN